MSSPEPTTPEAVTAVGAQMVGVLGAAAVLWGSLAALRAARIKVLIAYSTVAQIGYLFLLPAMAAGSPVGPGASAAWSGGVFHAVAHAVAKASLLMAAAGMAESTGSGLVSELRGAAVRRPLAMSAFGLASVSLVGLPPTGGFVAKWYLLVASVESGQWWWTAVVLLGGILTAVYLMRVLRPGFAPPAQCAGQVVRRPGDLVALVLALAALAIGMRPTELLELIDVGAPTAGG